MDEFKHDAFSVSYETAPLVFETATSAHFKCEYAFRDKDVVFHFYPKVTPIRTDFMSKLKSQLSATVGDRAERCTVEHIVDEGLEMGESVCLVVPGFTNKMISTSRRLSNKLLTDFHESLS